MADLIITGMSLSGGGMTITLPPSSNPITYYRWGFGDNSAGNFGALGSTTAPSSSTVSTPVLLDSLSWSQLSTDMVWYTGAAIKPDGTLWTWGKNSSGQLGDNTVIGKSSPVQTVASGNNWKQVSNGYEHTAAVKTDGTLWTWGRGSDGALGDNTSIKKSSPVQTVAGGTNWSQVSAGGYHTTAIKTDGTLWVWGSNINGQQLGDNTIISKSSPVQTIAGGSNWSQISNGLYTSSAIKTDGTLWMWGNNYHGQLGDNTRIHRSSPVQTIAAGTNWKQVASGAQSFTAAVKTDGTLWCWGRGDRGQLGDNNTIKKSSPVQTVAGGNNWRQVSAGGYFTAAIKTDNTLWTWGSNDQGQLGDNTVAQRNSPVQTIVGGTNWANVTAGSYTTLALRTSAI